ncbi:hypothetical protein PIROE2DRAFT_44575 [Piromyces sp. E2]|nr:hypothetical protein PIROE2DRAFT_44575 [Piromyces sp. E2]|eukprot:OUM62155.1 hypothetical protein PIROE2DRAFT_44575 [Piromyces sp. E2]
MSSEVIAFIGGGNMATSLIGGLVATGYDSKKLVVFEPNETQANKLKTNYNIILAKSGSEAITGTEESKAADIVLFAVKPQIIKEVATGVAAAIQKVNPLVISICAGIRTVDLSRWCGCPELAIVRVMPNTPALLQQGATGMFPNTYVNPKQKESATAILSSFSKSSYWVEKEELIDVVTGLSGSGPAYFFLMCEALSEAAQKLGLPKEAADGLAAQTCYGSGAMLLKGDEDAATLRKKVTSPNGTTYAALQSFEKDNFNEICFKAVEAATLRGKEMGEVFGQQ